VVVEGNRPELRRFDGYTGQVKTVNMSGRALVQFDAWANIGWYDIELGYLQVVPKPDPATAGKKAETKAAPKAEAKPAAKAEGAKPAAAKPAGGKMSVAEMLAAARANKPATAGAAPAAKAPAAEPAATAVAAEKPAAAAKPQPAAGGTELPKGQRPTVAQMIAYCREKDASAG
jgi:hypothetical protein